MTFELIDRVCQKCGQEKPDALPRNGKEFDSFTVEGIPFKTPTLCVLCCSTVHGREWMATSNYLKSVTL